MATNGASGACRRRSRQNSSMSPITSTPACRAASTDQCGAGCVSGAPGVSTSAAKFAHDTLRRSAVMKPACAAFTRLSAASSPAITSAPPAFSAWQLARPEPPSPNTATVLPAKEVTGIMMSFRGAPLRRERGMTNMPSQASPTRSPQLQRRQAGQRQHHRDDPEPDHDLRLGPSLLLEMVMQRRHPEYAFSGQLERDHLHDDGNRLEHEQPANDGEHQF